MFITTHKKDLFCCCIATKIKMSREHYSETEYIIFDKYLVFALRSSVHNFTLTQGVGLRLGTLCADLKERKELLDRIARHLSCKGSQVTIRPLGFKMYLRI